jgi:hypothetical protein
LEEGLLIRFMGVLVVKVCLFSFFSRIEISGIGSLGSS